MMYLDVCQLEIANQCVEKRDRLPSRLHQGERYLIIRNAERNAGNASSRSNVDDALRPGREESQKQQRVEEQAAADR